MEAVVSYLTSASAKAIMLKLKRSRKQEGSIILCCAVRSFLGVISAWGYFFIFHEYPLSMEANCVTIVL